MYILFICAGGVIHFIGDYQVICFIGGLSVYIRFTSSFMVYNFAICRVAFLVVFYSKDFKRYICIYIYIHIYIQLYYKRSYMFRCFCAIFSEI